MTPERYEQVNALAEAALKMSGTERSDFLRRSCGSDHDLRIRVYQLVRSYESSADFLEAPAFEGWARDIAATGQPSLAGRRLGRYVVLAHLGSGGIGEVWLAKDEELTREVAIKLLSQDLVRDSEHARRFRQEARAASSLNHPNIVTVFDIGEFEGRQFIAQEYIQGKTLGDLLRDGPLGLEAVLDIGMQVAAALSAAHAAQIVHRDIKPENIMVRPDGLVKVLDFGLARFLEAKPLGGLTNTHSLTRTGTILGTARYMSPEQVRDLPLDGRSDIFSFGVVLYELLAGKAPFRGDTAPDVLAAILTQDPAPLSTHLPNLPVEIENIVRRCLEKDPAARYRSADAVRKELAQLKVDVTRPGRPARNSHQRRRAAWSAVLLVVVAASIAGFLLVRARPTEKHEFAAVVRSSLALPAGHVPEVVTISPQGDQIVYQVSLGGVRRLYRRYLEEEEFRPIPGSEGGTQPFFSPEGKEIGFYTTTSLRVAGLSGSRDLVAVEPEFDLRRAVWGDDQFIYYTTPEKGIWRVPSQGGEPQPVIKSEPTNRGSPFYFPQQMLSGDGPSLLFSTNSGPTLRSVAWTGLRENVGEHILAQRGMGGQVTGGYLLYYWQGKLLAAPFDARRRKLTGSAVEVLDKVGPNGWRGPNASVSKNGTLVYLEADQSLSRLLWVDRSGRETPLAAPPANYEQAEVSPDGSKVSIARQDGPGLWSLWIDDLRSGAWTKLLDMSVPKPRSVWSPDGKAIIAAVTQGDAQFVNLYRISLAKPEAQERLTENPNAGQFPGSWSAAANAVLFTDGVHQRTQCDISVLPLAGARSPRTMVATKGADRTPAFSPDGRWFAYTSEAGTRSEVFIQRFDQTSPPQQVSRDGGVSPAWSPDGKRIYFLDLSRALMEVPYNGKGGTGIPHQLLPAGFTEGTDWWTRGYSIAPDGRFLVIRPVGAANRPNAQIRVIVNWIDELKRLVPVP